MTRQEATKRLNDIRKEKANSISAKTDELDETEGIFKDIDALDMALAFLSTGDIVKAKVEAEDRGKLRGRIYMCATILDGLDRYGEILDLVGLVRWISKIMNRDQKELDYLEGRSTDEIHSG